MLNLLKQVRSTVKFDAYVYVVVVQCKHTYAVEARGIKFTDRPLQVVCMKLWVKSQDMDTLFSVTNYTRKSITQYKPRSLKYEGRTYSTDIRTSIKLFNINFDRSYAYCNVLGIAIHIHFLNL